MTRTVEQVRADWYGNHCPGCVNRIDYMMEGRCREHRDCPSEGLHKAGRCAQCPPPETTDGTREIL